MNEENYYLPSREIHIRAGDIAISIKSDIEGETAEVLSDKALSMFMILENEGLKNKYIKYMKENNEWAKGGE